MNQKFVQWFLIGIFLFGFFLSRFYIYNHAPYQGTREDDALYVPGYSDVQYDYRRYANMWQDGHLPYFNHAYEYFPATIPFLYAPLPFQLAGIGDYYDNYRKMTFGIDVILFITILLTAIKLETSFRNQLLGIGFFVTIPAVLSNYWYEGIDLVFITSLIIAISSLVILKSKIIWQRVIVWFFVLLSTSIKLITLPLIPAIAASSPTILRWKKELFIAGVMLFIVWGLPLTIFRTSLSVPFVLLSQRHSKYSSTPSVIVETINHFTQTETYINQPPDFYWSGPVSQFVDTLSTIVYPLSILIIGLYAAKQIWYEYSLENQFWWLLHICLTLFLTTFLTGKIFSQPFHIWYVPIITLMLFKATKKTFLLVGLALWLIVFDTTKLWNPEFLTGQTILYIPAGIFRHYLRIIPMILMLITSILMLGELHKMFTSPASVKSNKH